jgi:PKD repeat protein
MANSNNQLKAYVRFDGTGRVIPGSLILQRFKPKVGNWQEINSTQCCNDTLPANCIEFTVDTTTGLSFSMTAISTMEEFTYTVNWADGNTESGSSGEGIANLSHDYASNGIYVVRLCFSNASIITEINIDGD